MKDQNNIIMVSVQFLFTVKNAKCLRLSKTLFRLVRCLDFRRFSEKTLKCLLILFLPSGRNDSSTTVK